MQTQVFKIDPLNIDLGLLKKAAEVINSRGLVAFPTETVYGLGANALDSKAAAGIFEAKKRPLDDPLIVHIAKKEDLYKLCAEVPGKIEKLISAFWPGPLTVILKKTEIVPDIVTTGLDTVAVRMPSAIVARRFIETCGVPIAAPSANLFSRPSPTDAGHVLEDLDGRIDVVLDGGACEIGVESTIVEATEGRISILRPGGVTAEDIKRILPGTEVKEKRAGLFQKTPGMYPVHYSPKAKIILIKEGKDQEEKTLSAAKKEIGRGRKTGLPVRPAGIMAVEEHAEKYKGFNVKVLGPKDDPKICAARLFRIFREFDREGTDIIIAEGIPAEGMGLAVMNRLKKASGR